MADVIKTVLAFVLDVFGIMARFRNMVFEKYSLAFHQIHLFAGRRDHVGDVLAGANFFQRPLDQGSSIGAILRHLDERILFLELLGHGAIPGVGAVEGERGFFLGALDQDLFPVGALIEGQL